MKNESEERALRAMDIVQEKLDTSIEQEDSIALILATRGARDIAIEYFEERFGRSPEYNRITGRWE